MRKISEAQKEKNKQKAIDSKELHEWLRNEIWDRRENEFGFCVCFETGAMLHRDYFRGNSCVYSHILAKNIYPEYKMESWNIKIVSPSAHHSYENFPEKAPKQYAYKKKLMRKLNIT